MEEEGAVVMTPLAALQNQVLLLSQAIIQLQHAPAPAGLQPRCPLLPPDRFEGKLEEFPAFLAQCKLFTEVRAQEFPTERSKVCFIISLLKGQVAKWATPLLLSASPLLDNYQAFLNHISSAFQNPVQAATANRRLRALKQGKDSVFDYNTAFCLIAQDLNWNEPALISQYMEGLADEVLDELSRVEQPNTLQELITLCLRIDGHLESRRLSQGKNYNQQPLPAVPNLQSGEARRMDPEPMQLGADRPRLTPEEKAR
ncbi:hypothetical protein JRQ81_019967 [Phrynocephalus forsythii]|uniref:DUF4939 domain-containing protein n=1 Tax=Phrynocephalus forsythii TaxID=171643 RepID=A0A9Q0XMW7_9SAUR|nr:hypothetical protein JRQ81_019967 [Phrynocephalus forsythii]